MSGRVPTMWWAVPLRVIVGYGFMAHGFAKLSKGAVFTVHLPYGFSSIKLIAVTKAGAQFGPPGYETALLYLACLAALILGGPGPLAIDNLRRAARATGRQSGDANRS